jgi:hypothetical protein
VASIAAGVGAGVAWQRVLADSYESGWEMAAPALVPALLAVAATVVAIVRRRVAPVALGTAIGAALVVVRVVIDGYFEWVASEVGYPVAAAAAAVQVVLLGLAVAWMGPDRATARLRQIGPAGAVLLVAGTACVVLDLLGAGSPEESPLAYAGKYVILSALLVLVGWLILVRLDAPRDVALVTALVVHLLLVAAELGYLSARYDTAAFRLSVLGAVLMAAGIVLAARRDGASWAEASSAVGAGSRLDGPEAVRRPAD